MVRGSTLNGTQRVVSEAVRAAVCSCEWTFLIVIHGRGGGGRRGGERSDGAVHGVINKYSDEVVSVNALLSGTSPSESL